MSKYCFVLVVCKYGSFVSLLYQDYRLSLRGPGVGLGLNNFSPAFSQEKETIAGGWGRGRAGLGLC